MYIGVPLDALYEQPDSLNYDEPHGALVGPDDALPSGDQHAAGPNGDHVKITKLPSTTQVEDTGGKRAAVEDCLLYACRF